MSTISCPLFSILSIASVSHTMSVHSTMFPVYQPFELERVMPVSSGLKTRSSNKTVLPLAGDSTPVVHAQEPALPHITQTLADCTPTAMDREPASPNLTPASPNLTPTPADCFAAAFICTGGQFWRPVYVICFFVPYICSGGELWCPVDVICVIAVIV